jgi:uncharacterized protein (DUF362 family)/Pyruvate/2-oxoacid:ferredoxin oxidoreductase delta subunit
MNKVSKVAVAGCTGYNQAVIDTGLQALISALQFKLLKNETVFIKPNIMSQNRPEQASVTHFSVVDGICRLLKDNNCRIRIGDSISFYQRGLTRKAFQTTRLDSVAKKYGAELTALEEEPLVRNTDKSTFLKEIFIPKAILDADMVIDVPKLKSHSLMRLSGAVKNMFGIMPGGYKQWLHRNTSSVFELADVFIDLVNISRPALFIMDAVVGLDGGPSAAGKPTFVGKLLASESPHALDAAACKMIGYEPSEIATIRRAETRGLIANIQDIEISEDNRSYSLSSYPFPVVLFKNIQKGRLPPVKDKDGVFVTKTFVDPKVKKMKVADPEKCVKVCPTGAIYTDSRNQLKIDPGKCINCYHCFYACKGVIGIRSSLMNKLIRAARFLIGI